MNPADYEYVELFLDSRDGTQANSGTSNLDYPMFLFNHPMDNVAFMKVLQAEIPFSYYTITNDNRSFVLIESTSATVSLPVGNYPATTLASTLATLLTTTSPTGKTYTVAYDAFINKFRITVNTGSFSLVFGSTGDNGLTNPRLLLGMNGGINSSVAGVLESPNTISVYGPNYVYLCSSTLASQVTTMLPNGSQNRGNIGPQICRIPVNCNAGEVIFYIDPAPEKWFRVPNAVQFNKLDFYLTLGTSPAPLSLQGQNFSIKIGLLLYRTSQQVRSMVPQVYTK